MKNVKDYLNGLNQAAKILATDPRSFSGVKIASENHLDTYFLSAAKRVGYFKTDRKTGLLTSKHESYTMRQASHLVNVILELRAESKQRGKERKKLELERINKGSDINTVSERQAEIEFSKASNSENEPLRPKKVNDYDPKENLKPVDEIGSSASSFKLIDRERLRVAGVNLLSNFDDIFIFTYLNGRGWEILASRGGITIDLKVSEFSTVNK